MGREAPSANRPPPALGSKPQRCFGTRAARRQNGASLLVPQTSTDPDPRVRSRLQLVKGSSRAARVPLPRAALQQGARGEAKAQGATATQTARRQDRVQSQLAHASALSHRTAWAADTGPRRHPWADPPITSSARPARTVRAGAKSKTHHQNNGARTPAQPHGQPAEAARPANGRRRPGGEPPGRTLTGGRTPPPSRSRKGGGPFSYSITV